ncbi:MAG: 4-(cytidine 5'-diphospho)-2-C-methyl-D-erythritol kinase [Brochothrix thermosphacta]|uniref:4-(cytidine 5'-diphospho)-2-C-methyl-D-erythritol kinase n=1 Tax=Brochothrix thermosphacta TaxID=2756 RepID=UPI00083F9AEB|nr:4-(cytidine 5'-diphospho)-2-C-methyl-D-erythritol kinase [Brochothrix thermosphacta]ANZ95098.1 4-(cytidine 5'-diphospho)-2-C-methyl-D-erythritol kinase [Brochothrix thermosphacta]ANZ96598.1 4-(cytidine 5'-diphospho)-2-C-methyl-D-erythritol kinase [Brochothrix thermosphacta]MDO7864228.1 4-(cytidine 5'-diphospho)-2-C-methyl-D-erythritol kinase [Brochothrix thermosphacta]ODJ56298.1 4-(cytidine 5'-diphospho)-2-C-methyl-D-erythritol kinase [Brochothrix thermosphacta]ODJ71318.1 4-(cytidine 5'-dip
MDITVKATAKLNLALDILGKRDDGYHELETVMAMVDLADYLDFSLRLDGNIKLESSSNAVPEDGRNLIVKAGLLLQRRFQVTKGATIKLDKKIPISAGMAGGSSDAAATLHGLNQLWELNLSLDELAEIGAEIGSDVSFCVYGGVAMCNGRGEKITPLPSLPPCWVVLAKPAISVSTRDVFSHLEVNDIQHQHSEKMLAAISSGDYYQMVEALGNDLEDYSLEKYAEISYLKKQFEAFGADAVLMSGTGPTVFAIVKTEKKAKRLYNSVSGFCKNVHMVRFLKPQFE